MKKLIIILLLLASCATTDNPYRDRYRAGHYARASGGRVYKILAVTGDTLRLYDLNTRDTVYVNRDAIDLEYITNDDGEYATIMVFFN